MAAVTLATAPVEHNPSPTMLNWSPSMSTTEVPFDHKSFPAQLAEMLRKEAIPEITFDKGAVIFNEGDAGHEAYFVLEGSVTIQKRDERGDPRVLDVLEEGAMFGEMALLDHPRRSATAVAAADLRLFVIPRNKVQQLIHNVPQMSIWLLDIFSRRLRRADDRLTQMEKVQEVASRVISAQQAERKQIARDLLDGPIAAFADYNMKLDLARASAGENAAIKNQLSALRDALTRGYSQLQTVVRTITPDLVAHEGLETLLAEHVGRIQKDSGLQVALNCPVISPSDVNYHIQSTVFCLVQAALTHIQAYGEAKRVEVAVILAQQSLQLMIADDGQGFDVAKVRAGYYKEEMENFEAMRERVRLVGGAMRLKSQPGKGTLMDFTIPVTGEKSIESTNP